MSAWLVLILAAGALAADERLILHTPHGDLVAVLFPEAAPKHVAQVSALARLGAYDATPVARVLRGYLVQFSGPRARRLGLAREQLDALRPLRLEAGGLAHTRGTLTMSRRRDDPDSAEGAFSILLKDARHLDGEYTAFGRLERGWEVLDALAALPLDGDEPRHWIEISRAEVVRASRVDAALDGWGPPGAARRPRAELAWLLAAVVAAGAAAAAFGGRVLRAACLLNALLAFVAVLIALQPSLPARGWAPVLVFASALGLFRLLAAFEP